MCGCRHMAAKEWHQEVSAFLRALSGAFLFGVPLLYTMEMWWLGAQMRGDELGIVLLVSFVANLGLNHFAGFRRGQGWDRTLEQAIDALAVGAVASTVVLLALNRIYLGTALNAAVGQVVLQTLPLSIGASVANAVFAHGAEAGAGTDSPPPR